MKTHHLIIICAVLTASTMMILLNGIENRNNEMQVALKELEVAKAKKRIEIKKLSEAVDVRGIALENANQELDKLLHKLAKEKMSEAQNLIWRSNLEIRVMESGKNEPVRFFNASKYAKQAEEKNREALEILKHVSK